MDQTPPPSGVRLDGRTRELLAETNRLRRLTGLLLLEAAAWYPAGFRRWKARRAYLAKPSAN